MEGRIDTGHASCDKASGCDAIAAPTLGTMKSPGNFCFKRDNTTGEQRSSRQICRVTVASGACITLAELRLAPPAPQSGTVHFPMHTIHDLSLCDSAKSVSKFCEAFAFD